MPTWSIILIAVAISLLVIILLIILIRKCIKDKNVKKAEEQVKETIEDSTTRLADCFGGKDNIEEIQQNGSRVSVLVKDSAAVNKEIINQILPNVMYMGKKIVFVIGSDSEDFKAKLDEKIEAKK